MTTSILLELPLGIVFLGPYELLTEAYFGPIPLMCVPLPFPSIQACSSAGSTQHRHLATLVSQLHVSIVKYILNIHIYNHLELFRTDVHHFG